MGSKLQAQASKSVGDHCCVLHFGSVLLWESVQSDLRGTTEGPSQEGKIWRLLKSPYGTRDSSQVFFDVRGGGAVVPCLYWGAMLEAFGVHWGDDFISGIPDDKADDLEQLMREVFKVKICERIGPGFLASVEFLHKKVGRNAEGFSWTHDPKHTLAMADGFGPNAQLEFSIS